MKSSPGIVGSGVAQGKRCLFIVFGNVFAAALGGPCRALNPANGGTMKACISSTLAGWNKVSMINVARFLLGQTVAAAIPLPAFPIGTLIAQQHGSTLDGLHLPKWHRPVTWYSPHFESRF